MPGNLAPTWDLIVNGSKLVPDGIKALISTVEVDATVDGADELTIKGAAYDPTGTAAERWALVGSTILAPGNMVTVYGGYSDGDDLPTCLQRFRLVSLDVDYGEGVPKVTIRGYSAEARLAEYTEARAWEGPVADSTIVQELADEHGITVDLETADERDEGRIKPRGTSDLAFLRQLATANGYGPPVVRYDEDADADVLAFKPQEVDSSSAYTFTHDPTIAEADRSTGNLLRFRASLDLHGVPTKLVVGGFDPDTQEPVVVTVQVSDAGQDPVILTGEDAADYEIKGAGEFQARALADSDDPRSELTEALALPSTVVTVEDAVDYATRWAKLRWAAFQTGEATILGHPKVWIGQVHNFDGLAPIHVGLWEVLGARHTFTAQGYTTSLDVARVLEDQAEPEEA